MKSLHTLGQNIAFVWLVVITGLLLLIPLTAMQFTSQIKWSLLDFLVMGLLLLGVGGLFIVTSRKIDRKHWPVIGIFLLVTFVYLWAELAVGVFTNIGS